MKVSAAVVFSSGSLYVYQILSLLYTMYLAREFSPYVLGAFGIASSITLLSGDFKALGTGEYLIREKYIDRDIVRNSLGITCAISYLSFFAIVFSASWFSKFYGDDLVGELTVIFSLSLLVSSFNSINSSLLARSLEFRKVILLDWLNFLSGVSVSIVLILLGFGIYSVAIGAVCGIYFQFLFSFIVKAEQMCFVPKLNNVGNQLRFGWLSSGSSILTRLNLYSIDLLIGKFEGLKASAIISKTISTSELVFHTIVAGARDVALPYISKLEEEKFAGNYFYATTVTNTLTLPVLVSLIFVGDSLILLLFGEQWIDSAELIGFIAVWAVFKNLHPFLRALMISLGKEADFLFNQALGLFFTVTAVFLGVLAGDLKDFSIFLAFSGLAYFVISTLQVIRTPQFIGQFGNFVKSQRSVVLVCLGVAFASYVIENYLILGVENLFLRISIFGSILVLVWIALCVLINAEIYREIRRLVGKY